MFVSACNARPHCLVNLQNGVSGRTCALLLLCLISVLDRAKELDTLSSNKWGYSNTNFFLSEWSLCSCLESSNYDVFVLAISAYKNLDKKKAPLLSILPSIISLILTTARVPQATRRSFTNQPSFQIHARFCIHFRNSCVGPGMKASLAQVS